MAPKRKRQRRWRRMEGGKAPFVVDFKKGFQLLTDKEMWKIPSKAEEKKFKRGVANASIAPVTLGIRTTSG